jgi:hypothetical protein
MKIIDTVFSYLDKFTIHFTSKKKSLLIASVGIILNFIFSKKVHSETYLPKNKKEYLFVKPKTFKKVIGAKNKKIDIWFKSDRNFMMSCIENIKTTLQLSFYRQKTNINTNISCHNSLVLVEKLNEGEKLRNKISKLNLGEVVFSGINILRIKNFKIFSALEIEAAPYHQSCLQSFETLSNSNPDIQFSNSLFFHIKDTKNFFNIQQHIPSDHVRGFVLANFGANSGSILSNNFLIRQKLDGFYSKKNLSQAFNKQIKYSSIKLRPLSPIIINNKLGNDRRLFNSSNFLPKSLIILKVLLYKCRIIRYESFRKIMLKKNEKRNDSINNEELYIFRIHKFFFYHSRVKNNFLPKLGIFVNLRKNYLRLLLNLIKDLEEEILSGKSIFSQLKLDEIIPVFTLILQDYIQKNNNKVHPTKYFFLLDSTVNFSKRYVKLHKIKKYEHLTGFRILKSTQKIDIRLYSLNKKKIEFTKLLGENIKSYKNFIFQTTKFERHDPLVAHFKISKNENETIGIKLIGICFSIGMFLPKSIVESSKFYNLSSSLGNSIAQFYLSNIFFLGKCFSRNRSLSYIFSKASFKRGHLKALFNTAIYLKNKIGTQGDLYRAFNLMKKVQDYSAERRKITTISISREKSDIFKIFFASMIKIREYKIIKFFVFSFFVQNMSFLPTGILNKSEAITSTLNFQNLSSLKNSIQSIVKLSELLLENGQDFLSIEKFRLLPDFIHSSHFHIIFSRISGIGFRDGPVFSKRSVSDKSGSLDGILLNFLYRCGLFIEIRNYWFIYFLSVKFRPVFFICLMSLVIVYRYFCYHKILLYETAKKILIPFFQFEAIKQAVRTTYFFLLGFYEYEIDNYSSYSYLLFISFTILKKLHEPRIKNYLDYKKSLDKYSKKYRFISIVFLSVLIHIENFLSRMCLKFYRRRLVNSIVGPELIYLSSVLRGLLLVQIFSFINRFLIQNKWISVGSCLLHLKLLTSLFGLFSYYIGIKNSNITSIGLYRIFLLMNIVRCISEIKENYLDLIRFRNTDIAINLWMKKPSLDNIEKLGDKLCAICLDEMLPDFSKKLHCTHIFHTVCLQDWLQRKFHCPLCRRTISSAMSEVFNVEKNSNYQNQSKKKLNIIAAVTGFCRNDLNIQQDYHVIQKAEYLPSLNPTINDILFNCHRKISISNPNFKEEGTFEKSTCLIETKEKSRSILFDSFVRYSKKTVGKKTSSKTLSGHDTWKKIEKKVLEEKIRFFLSIKEDAKKCKQTEADL